MLVTKGSLDRRSSSTLLLMGALLLAACSHTEVALPGDDQFGLEARPSDAGIFTATAIPAEPLQVGRMHGWTLVVKDRDGKAVEEAEIKVDGGMPQHGHGLPTRPRVTAERSPGEYQVDGMRFNMGGWWVVHFEIAAAGGEDRITFNLEL